MKLNYKGTHRCKFVLFRCMYYICNRDAKKINRKNNKKELLKKFFDLFILIFLSSKNTIKYIVYIYIYIYIRY